MFMFRFALFMPLRSVAFFLSFCVVSFRFFRFSLSIFDQIWLCEPCGEKYTKRNYCPTCGVTFDEADNSVKAVGCSACEFWVHAACAGLSSVGVWLVLMLLLLWLLLSLLLSFRHILLSLLLLVLWLLVRLVRIDVVVFFFWCC